MNIEQMTEILQNIIMQAVQLAQEKQSPDIKPEHILYAMVNDDSLGYLAKATYQSRRIKKLHRTSTNKNSNSEWLYTTTAI